MRGGRDGVTMAKRPTATSCVHVMPPTDEVTEVNAVSKLLMSQRDSYVTVTPAFDSDAARLITRVIAA